MIPSSARETEEVKMKALVRDSIREFFKERACFVLPRPVADEKLLRNVEELNYDSLKVPFREGLEDLISYLRSSIKPKIVNNVAVDGRGYVKLIESIAGAINNNSLPTLSTTWDRIVESEMRDTLQKAFDKLKFEMEKLQEQLPIEESELYKLLFIVKYVVVYQA